MTAHDRQALATTKASPRNMGRPIRTGASCEVCERGYSTKNPDEYMLVGVRGHLDCLTSVRSAK